MRCFVPAEQLGDVQIGPLLGDTLVRSGQLSDAELATALDKPKESARGKAGPTSYGPRHRFPGRTQAGAAIATKPPCGEARRAAVGGGSDLR